MFVAFGLQLITEDTFSPWFRYGVMTSDEGDAAVERAVYTLYGDQLAEMEHVEVSVRPIDEQIMEDVGMVRVNDTGKIKVQG